MALASVFVECTVHRDHGPCLYIWWGSENSAIILFMINSPWSPKCLSWHLPVFDHVWQLLDHHCGLKSALAKLDLEIVCWINTSNVGIFLSCLTASKRGTNSSLTSRVTSWKPFLQDPLFSSSMRLIISHNILVFSSTASCLYMPLMDPFKHDLLSLLCQNPIFPSHHLRKAYRPVAFIQSNLCFPSITEKSALEMVWILITLQEVPASNTLLSLLTFYKTALLQYLNWT